MLRPERLDADFDDPKWTRGELIVKPTVEEELSKPLTAPAPGRWSRPPKRTRDPRFLVIPLFVASVLGLEVPLLMAAGRGGTFEPLSLWIAGVFFVAANLGGFLINRSALRAHPEDVGLLEDRDDAAVGLVQIEIVRDRKRIGRDRGAVWFADGLLLFSGHATSFALGGEDVLPPSERHGPYRAYPKENTARPSLPETALPLRLEDGWAYVLVEPLHGGDPIEGKREFRFLKTFARFRRNPPPSRGPRQWPPLEP